jgi:hypothetical protein
MINVCTWNKFNKTGMDVSHFSGLMNRVAKYIYLLLETSDPDG